MGNVYGVVDNANDGAVLCAPHITGNNCILCGEAFRSGDTQTFMLSRPSDSRGYFYRLHKSCHRSLGQEADDIIKSIMTTLIDLEANALKTLQEQN
jgi:hypothetical protein